MEKYTVFFTYGIEVNAKDEYEAEAEAKKVWDEITPRTDEMNVSVEKHRK